MRPDVGLATLPQRLAGLAALRPSAARTAQADPAFARTLAEQAAQQGGTTGLQVGASMLPNGYSGTRTGPSTAAALQARLGPGVSLHDGPSVIRPALPGAVGGAYDTGQVGGLDHDHGDHVEGPDHVHGPPALDRTGPPPELQAYGNGRIPAAALEPLGVGEHRLWSPAARAFRDLEAAAARDGVQIGINSSYRDLPTQVEMVERYGLYSQGGRAAAPGTSNHGWGVSIDLQLDAEAQAWMRDHAGDYGFVEDVPREPWHWTFKASSY